MRILDRYHSAIFSSNLKPDDTSTAADLDVLGAVGVASKYEPIGVGLARMLAGGGDGELLEIMGDAIHRRSYWLHVKISRTDTDDMARAVVGWWRFGRCNPCGGTGYRLIPGTPSLGDDCPECRGTKKIAFERQFRPEWRELAAWARDEIGRSLASAGGAAMRSLDPNLGL